jgi:hypothetical protein
MEINFFSIWVISGNFSGILRVGYGMTLKIQKNLADIADQKFAVQTIEEQKFADQNKKRFFFI